MKKVVTRKNIERDQALPEDGTFGHPPPAAGHRPGLVMIDGKKETIDPGPGEPASFRNLKNRCAVYDCMRYSQASVIFQAIESRFRAFDQARDYAYQLQTQEHLSPHFQKAKLSI
jgi:hypothetical protein